MFNSYSTHHHQNITRIDFPSTINVHEHKAPTDESIRLMEEMHKKAMDNIIARVKVEDNLITGECIAYWQPWMLDEYEVCCKFKINNHDFEVRSSITRRDVYKADMTDALYETLKRELENHAKAVMLWYALRMFAKVAFKQITGSEPPSFFLELKQQ